MGRTGVTFGPFLMELGHIDLEDKVLIKHN